ncbi:MAG: hydroxypyruvate isomerase family protein [Pararhodobacter sp.]
MLFSANLGMLWTELALPDAVRAAHRAGFDAVECHFPYDTPAARLREALDETGLALIALNTRPGDRAAGDFGLCALPDRRDEARAAMDQAIAYGAETGAGWVHVMAGKGGDDATFRDALRHACDKADAQGMGVLIEPLNAHDVPEYFLRTLDQAAEIIDTLALPNLRLMFDCYHTARTEGGTVDDIAARFEALRPLIGHVQFAAVPDRGAPDHGAVDYASLLPRLRWPGPIGAEYRPEGDTGASLGWMATLRR